MSQVTETKDQPAGERKETPGNWKERRKHPRIPLRENASVFKLDEGFKVLGDCNISAGGLNFYSDHKFEPGRHMRLNINNTLGVEIEIVRCEMVMIDGTFMEARYQIAAKFVGGPIDQDLYDMALETMEKR